MRDRNGIEVRVEYLEWQETYRGWIEGEPEYMNEVILNEHFPRELSRWPHTPHLVFRAEERRKRSPKVPATRWLPPERVIAFLASNWRSRSTTNWKNP